MEEMASTTSRVLVIALLICLTLMCSCSSTLADKSKTAKTRIDDAVVTRMMKAVLDDDADTLRQLLSSQGNGDTSRAYANAQRNGEMPLVVLAATLGRLEPLVALVEYGADVNVKDGRGGCAIDYASKMGRDSIVQLLLSQGADVHARSPEDQTPLHSAAHGGHLATVNALLAYGADVNVVDVDGTTPLHGVAGISRTDREKITRAHDSFVAEFAVDKAPSNPNEDFDAVKTAEALIAAGANVNAKDNDGADPFTLAARTQNFDVLEVLIRHGADPAIETRFSHAPSGQPYTMKLSDLARQRGFGDDLIAYMREEGKELFSASVAHAGSIPLDPDVTAEYHNAIHANDIDTVEDLLRAHGKIYAQAATLDEPLVITAAHYNRLEILKLLVQHSGDINAIGKLNTSVLDTAVQNNRLEMVEWLLSEGATSGKTKETALHLACIVGNPAIVRLLIKHGWDVKARNVLGQTPLHQLSEINDDAKREFSLVYEAHIKHLSEGRRPSNPLDDFNASGTVDALVEAGADLTATESRGLDPLMLAAYKQNFDVVEALLRHGVDSTVEIITADGRREKVKLSRLAGNAGYGGGPKQTIDFLKNSGLIKYGKTP